MATLVDINHNSGGTVGTHWSTVDDADPRLSITGAAGLDSSAYGLQCTYSASGDTAASVSNSVTSPTTGEMTFTFRFDPNSWGGSGTDTMARISLEETTSSKVVCEVDINVASGGGREARVVHGRDADFTETASSFYTFSDQEVEFKVEMKQESTGSSADGEIYFYIDDVQKYSATNLENNAIFDLTDVIVIVFVSNSSTGTLYFDEFLVTDVVAAAAANAFRFLGFATDNTNLYVAGLKDEDELKLYDYDLSTLAENGTATFGGTVTSSDIDNQTRGIFPVAKPFADQVLYLYGRDGNNTQVQYNDLNGTLGWTDIGAGTATWGTDKMAAGLHPHPLAPNDVMVVFTDNDVYRTLLGTVTWAKMGDATGTVRTTARSPSKRGQLVAAGTAAGTIYHTQNIGVSFEDAGGTAMGTINAFEFNSGAVL